MTLEAAEFTAFVRAHSRSLYGTAYLLTGNPDAAEDLLQDTLAALYPKWTRVAAGRAVRRVCPPSTGQPVHQCEPPQVRTDVAICGSCPTGRPTWTSPWS